LGATALNRRRSLWLAVATGPIAAVIAQGVGYGLNSAACGEGSRWISLLVIGLALASNAAAAGWLLRCWRGQRSHTSASPPTSTFVVEAGLAGSVFFFIVVAAFALTPLLIYECH
jgi:hypothetical protein